MKKTYQLKTNAIKGEPQIIDIAPATGKAPVTVPAAAGARYELVDAQTRSGPDNIRVQRKGKNLQVFFDGDTEAGVVIEDFYQVHTDSTPTLVGRTDQGTFYEYIPEIAAPSAIVTNLNDTGVAYGVALGGQELAATSGAAIGALVPLVGAFSPLLVGGAALGAAALAGGGGGGGGDSPAASPVFPDPNVMPNTGQKTAISLNAVTGDNIITTGENTGNIALTGKVTGYFAADDIVTVYVNGKSYTGKALADGSFSINVPASELTADKDTKIEAKVIGTGGDTANAAQDYAVETAANAGKQTALSIDPITEDNLINASEKYGTVDITGKLTGPFAATDTITLSVNGKTFTGLPKPDGTFSIPVPATDLTDDSDTTIEGTIGTAASAIQNYGVDTTNPSNETLKIVISTDKAKDDGVVNNTELNGATQFTSHITLNSSAQVGDKVTIVASHDGGTQPSKNTIERVLTASDIQNGFDVSFDKPDDGRTQTVKATYADAFGNEATNAAATDSAKLDATVPTVAVTSNLMALKKGETANITFTLSEASTDFTIEDISFTGGTLSKFTGSGTSYTAMFTPTDGINSGSIKIDNGKFSDAAGNFNTDGADANNIITLGYDFTLPTIAVTSNVSSLKKGETATVTFALSEASTDFTADDITVSGGTLSTFAGSGTKYTATFTPTGETNNGSGSIKVDSAKFSDAAGNLNADGLEANNTINLTYDTAAPTQTAQVTAIIDDTSPNILPNNTSNTYHGTIANGGITNDTRLKISGTLSAAIDASDTVHIYDGSIYLGNATVSGTTWTFDDLRTLSDGQKVSYTAQVSDAAGNQSSAGTAYTATLDTQALRFNTIQTSETTETTQGQSANGVGDTSPTLILKNLNKATFIAAAETPLEAGTYKLHLGSSVTIDKSSSDGHLDIKTESLVSSVKAQDIYLEFWDQAGNYSKTYVFGEADTRTYNIPATTQFVV